MFWFMLIALVAVVAAVALAVLGDGGPLKDTQPERIHDPLPPNRPLVRADVDAVRLPVAVRGYRMADVDEVLDRLAAELAERDARLAELEALLAGVHAGAALGGQQQDEQQPAGPSYGQAGQQAGQPGQEYGRPYGQAGAPYGDAGE